METLRGEQESANKEKMPNSLGQLSFLVQTNPLLINTVLRSLFGFVDYETLKECRLVCHQWKENCDWMFINQSAFARYNIDQGIPNTSTESPVDIPTLFQSINQENHEVRFSAYKFQLRQLTLPVREMYLEPYKTTMTHLEIIYQINVPHTIKHNADYLIGPNLVKLNLNADISLRWRLSMEKLLGIRQLELTNCAILVKPGVRIAPKELKLDCCCFHTEGSDVRFIGIIDIGFLHIDEPSPINNFIDFSSTEKLDLTDLEPLFSDRTRSSQFLNFSDCVNIKSLCLHRVNINLDAKIFPKKLILEENRYIIDGNYVVNVLLTDYLSPDAQINKLKLNDKRERLDFQKSLSIDELEIESFGHRLNIGATVVTNIKKLSLNIRIPYNFDVTCLPIPKTIEVLKLTNDGSGKYQACREPISFPKLKQLSLGRECADWFQDFQNCPELLHLSLKNSYCQKLETLNVDLLPPNIKTLSLEKIFGVDVIGDRKLDLTVLVFSSALVTTPNMSDMDEIVSTLKKLLTCLRKVELIVFRKIWKISARAFQKFGTKDITKIMNLKEEMPQANISFGPVGWESEDCFKNSDLISLVDKKSEYYLFEGTRGKGKGISELEFSKLFPTF